ncbi:MAG: hypothetical protein B6U85_06350 [Desulfurococcales archaeon ex4484_42]|nr:MAG: hypothetical protein B6U85_06350 [Desulfurococcales archaeon ex4484_42]
MSSVIVVRNVDRNIYRRVKSIATLKGYTMGEALTEAMKLWLLLNEINSKEYLEYLLQREKSEKKLKEVQEKYGSRFKGKYVVICDGELIKICGDEEEAYRIVSKIKATQCIIAQLGRITEEEKRLELGMGIFE